MGVNDVEMELVNNRKMGEILSGNLLPSYGESPAVSN